MKNLEEFGVIDLEDKVTDIFGGCQIYYPPAKEEKEDTHAWWCVFCWIDKAYE